MNLYRTYEKEARGAAAASPSLIPLAIRLCARAARDPTSPRRGCRRPLPCACARAARRPGPKAVDGVPVRSRPGLPAGDGQGAQRRCAFSFLRRSSPGASPRPFSAGALRGVTAPGEELGAPALSPQILSNQLKPTPVSRIQTEVPVKPAHCCRTIAAARSSHRGPPGSSRIRDPAPAPRVRSSFPGRPATRSACRQPSTTSCSRTRAQLLSAATGERPGPAPRHSGLRRERRMRRLSERLRRSAHPRRPFPQRESGEEVLVPRSVVGAESVHGNGRHGGDVVSRRGAHAPARDGNAVHGARARAACLSRLSSVASHDQGVRRHHPCLHRTGSPSTTTTPRRRRPGGVSTGRARSCISGAESFPRCRRHR